MEVLGLLNLVLLAGLTVVLWHRLIAVAQEADKEIDGLRVELMEQIVLAIQAERALRHAVIAKAIEDASVGVSASLTLLHTHLDEANLKTETLEKLLTDSTDLLGREIARLAAKDEGP